MVIRFHWHPLSFLWVLLAVVSIGITGYWTYQYRTTKQHFLDTARADAQLSTEKAAQKINSYISILKPIAHSVANEIEQKSLTAAEIKALLKEKKPIEISGLGVAFLPHAFDPQIDLFSPYYFEKDGEEQLASIGEVYNYTAPENQWFHLPLSQGAMFIEPYYAAASQTIVAEYAVPIYRMINGKRKAIGVAYANQSVEHLKHILSTLFLSHTGYWAILSDSGTYLAHPQDQLVRKQTSIFDLAKQLKNDSLADAGKKILEHERTFLEYRNEITNANSWLFSEPIEGTNWTIIGVFDKGELPIDPLLLRSKMILPSIGGLLCIIFLLILLLSIVRGEHLPLWWVASIVAALALASQIGWTWYAILQYPSHETIDTYLIDNKTDLYSYVKNALQPYHYGKTHQSEMTQEQAIQESLTTGYLASRLIPTGIFVNNMQFKGANEIAVNAYVWQRFTDGIHDNLPRGFLFPQATESVIREISNIKEGNTQTIIWEAYAKLNQFFHFENYPFDVKTLRIQLWHRYLKKNVVLIPDLDSYQLINPRSLPGIDDEAYLPGWNIISSSFGYKTVNFTSNFGNYAVGPFGIYKSVDKSEVPELYFDVVVSREIIDTLIADLLPVAVIAFLLFGILLVSTKEWYGGAIGACASVFFGTIFAQVRFRSKIPQAQIVYFENFYFLLYFFILAVIILTVLYQLDINISWIKYRKNLIAKLLYWPIFFSTLSILTLWHFY